MSIANAIRDLLASKFDPATSELYATCVKAARQPVFYARLGVPDSIDGRFDLILLHVVLAMLRMQDGRARQKLFDLMFADMERSLREMGVGDMGIGKKMKPMLSGFYGRAEAYKAALAEKSDDALTQALARNLYGVTSGEAPHASAIASYVRQASASLAAQNDNDLAAGRVSFPFLAENAP